jgi:hypothetical protein
MTLMPAQPTRLAAALLLAAGPLLAGSTVFTVVNTNDSGSGSLRAAIVNANGTPTSLIVFDIPGAGVQTIAPLSPLPPLTASVTIDGYTQPGASPNALTDGNDAVLLIEIDGTNLGSVGIDLQGGGSTVRGLVVNRVPGTAVQLAGTGGHVLAGNFIGTDAAGATAFSNTSGVSVSSPDNRVGGTLPADRNVISGNGFPGVGAALSLGGENNRVEGNFIGTNAAGTASLPNGRTGIELAFGSGIVGGPAAGARNLVAGHVYGIEQQSGQYVIQGNYVGTDVSGTAALPNAGTGITIVGDGNVVGGAAPGEGNLVSGNGGHGLLLAGATHTDVLGNRIGTDAAETAPLGNLASGISVQFGSATIPSDNRIGGLQPGDDNVIAFNGSAGIALSSATRTSMRRNRIFRNREISGLSGLGIDLDHDSVTPNDDGDADTGANGLLNFPLIRSVESGPGTTRIQATLRGAPDQTFGIDFYWSSCNFRPRDFLQGENFLASAFMFTDSNGFAEIDITYPVSIPAGAPVSATATDADDNTSELSQQIVFAIAPASGPPAGGTSVSITGTNFDPAVAVTIGGLSPANLVRVSDTELTAEAPALPPGSLNDVVAVNPDSTTGTLLKGWVADFLDVPANHQFYANVTRLVSNGVTVGCGGGLYCVDNPTIRAQMAVFLIRARLGFCFTPPPATGTVFGDVQASNIYAPWIEELDRQGLTAGCGNGNYCPDASITRAQMAVFLLNTAYGPGYVPPPATGTVFDDVPQGAFADDWIEDLVGRGITAGCSAAPPLYCPGNPITRGQMATFIVKTFELQP